MDDAHDAEPEQSPYVRLPWALVAAGLVGVLVVALAAGLFANRYLRPQLGVVPTPIPPAAAAAAPTSASTPTVTAVSTEAPTFTVAATATAVVAPAAAATPTFGAAPTAQGQQAPAEVLTPTPVQPAVAPNRTPSPSALPTVEPALADEVGKAYELFWRVRSQALLELDTTHLAEVMDGDYLQQFESNLEDLRMQGRAIKTQVLLNYVVEAVSDEDMIVTDRVEDDSFYVKPGTLQPLTDPSNDLLRIQFKLRKTAGVWKVVDSVSAD